MLNSQWKRGAENKEDLVLLDGSLSIRQMLVISIVLLPSQDISKCQSPRESMR
jgi:hypothetical protein